MTPPTSKKTPLLLSTKALTAARQFWEQPELSPLFSKYKRVALGVSGGADSMALLYLMAGPFDRPPWAPEIIVAHINHALREKESDADQEKVARLARQLGVPFRYRLLDADQFRRQAKDEGIESAARTARYKALAEIMSENRCQALVLAHHQDDLAETFLMRLLRGSGLMGLGGFSPETEVEGITLLRPLIDWPRAAVREVARRAGLDWGEDAMNRDLELMRNRLRQRVLPYLDRMTDHPPVVRMLARTARRLEAEGKVLRTHVATLYHRSRLERNDPRRVGISREVIASENALFAPYFLRMLMCDVMESDYPPNADRIAELVQFSLQGKPGTLMQTAANVVVWLDREGKIWAYRKTQRKMGRQTLIEIFEKENSK